MRRIMLAALAAACSTGSAQATVISFDIDAAVSPFTGTYTQNGFTVTYVSGGLRLLNNNGYFGDVLAGGNAAGGSFDLTRADGGLFSIQSFQGGSGLANTMVTYDLLGYLSGANTYIQTLSATGTTARSENLFTFTPTPGANTFDRITFSIRSSQSSAIVDNINLTGIAAQTPAQTPDPVTPAAAVPESATWAMMIFGFGVVGGTMRRRRHDVAMRLT